MIARRGQRFGPFQKALGQRLRRERDVAIKILHRGRIALQADEHTCSEQEGLRVSGFLAQVNVKRCTRGLQLPRLEQGARPAEPNHLELRVQLRGPLIIRERGHHILVLVVQFAAFQKQQRRRRLFELLGHRSNLGVKVSMSPSSDGKAGCHRSKQTGECAS